MRYRNLLDSFEWLCSVGNVIDGVKNIGAVIPRAACIADADDHIFKDDETLLVLERLALNLLGTHGSFAVFAPITVDGIAIVLW